jgi:antitoxin ParD1/3/4
MQSDTNFAGSGARRKLKKRPQDRDPHQVPTRTGDAFATVEQGSDIMPMVTVSISPEQAARMREAVNSGAYASGSEVVRAALRLWAASAAANGADTEAAAPVEADRERLNVAELYAAHTGHVRRA